MLIRGVRSEDLIAVETLLASAGLPLDGVAEHFAGFFVAEDGAIVGAAGLELYEAFGLLRSVVVAPVAAKQGLGRRLTESVLQEADRRGVRALYLLTTTAADYFVRLGFDRIVRADLPAALHASRELQGACPASATVMCRPRP